MGTDGTSVVHFIEATLYSGYSGYSVGKKQNPTRGE